MKSRRRLWQMRLAATAATAVLILVACWSAGGFERWWEWFAPAAEAPATARVPAPVVPTPPVIAPAGPPKLADEGAVGQMRLVATQPGRNVREGTAQLATDKADALTYMAGALLANGASLVEVHSDHVVLKRDSSTTELYVETMAPTARAGKAAPVNAALITVDPPAARQNNKTVGPETYANLVRVAPSFAANRVVGFEVYPGTDASAFGRLNLRTGDVLLEIDGRALQSVEQLYGSLKSIRGGASLTATVQRGSEQLVVSMDGAMLQVQEPPTLAELPPR